MIDRGNKYNHLLYSRGFIISKTSCKPINFWTEFTFGPIENTFYISFDPQNNCVWGRNDSAWALLLGTALDPNECHMESDRILNQILDCLSSSKEAFYDYIDTLCGRHIIVFGNDQEAYILQDATGMRSVYYSQENCIVASHYELIHDMVNTPYQEFYKQYEKYIPNIENTNRSLPGRITPYQRITTLIPNHELDMGTLKMRRFWPRSPKKAHGVNEAMEYILMNFENQAKTLPRYYEHFVMSLTAGLDSRVTMSIIKNFRKNVLFFTYYDEKESLVGANTTLDSDFAEEFADLNQLEYKRLTLPDTPDEDILEICKKNHYQRHITRVIKAYRDITPKGALHLRSNILEIIRGRKTYRELMQINTAKALRNYHYRNIRFSDPETEAECIGAFQEFLDSADYDHIYDYSVQDLMYWEERLGLWQAGSVLLESDLAFDTYCFFNCRRLLEYGLSIPKYYRDKNTIAVECIQRFWPEIYFNLPNQKEALYDYMGYETGVFCNLKTAKVSYDIKGEKKPFIKQGIHNCAIGFGSGNVMKGDTVRFILNKQLVEGEIYTCQLSLTPAPQDIAKRNMVHCEFCINRQKIYHRDLFELNPSIEQMTFSFKASAFNILEIALIADATYENDVCGFVELNNLAITKGNFNYSGQDIRVYTPKDAEKIYEALRIKEGECNRLNEKIDALYSSKTYKIAHAIWLVRKKILKSISIRKKHS